MTVFDDMICAGPASDRQIGDLTTYIDTSIPSEYRDFLETYGAAVGKGFIIYGLPPQSDGPPMWSDTIAVTKRLPSGCKPENSIAISSDGMDATYFLVCSDSEKFRKGQVVAWGPDFGEGEAIASSFYAFVAKMTSEHTSRE